VKEKRKKEKKERKKKRNEKNGVRKKEKNGVRKKEKNGVRKKKTEFEGKERKERKEKKKKKMAAATSIGIPLGAEYTFSELNGGDGNYESYGNYGSYGSYGNYGTNGSGARPVSSVGGFGLSALVVSSRSGVIVGAQSAEGGAMVNVGASSFNSSSSNSSGSAASSSNSSGSAASSSNSSGSAASGSAPFLIAATFDASKAHVPVVFGDVYLRVEGGAVTAYAADGPRASIQVDGDEVFAAFCDFGNGERPGALVVRTKSTMSIQRAERTQCTVPRGPFFVPIEQGADVWVFYGDAETIEAETAGIQNSVLGEVATLAAREAAMGARPSSLDRSVYGLMDTGASLYGPATIVEPSFYYDSTGPSITNSGYGSGSGFGSGSGRSGPMGMSGYGYGTGSGIRNAGLVTPGPAVDGLNGTWSNSANNGANNGAIRTSSSTGETWPRVWSSRESLF
jgi:hypothetical protein